MFPTLRTLVRQLSFGFRGMAEAAASLAPDTAPDEALSELPFSGAFGPEEPAAKDRVRRPKKRKFALLLTYSGKEFYGMQINPGVKTVESELFRALRLEGLIEEADEAQPGRFGFQRAARTDKGVSAVRQVVSIMLPLLDVDARELPDKLNAHLPPPIRAIEMKRGVRSFDAKRSCDSRTYSYTMPTFALASIDEITSEEYRLSEERRGELNALLGKYVGTHNFFNYTSRREHGHASCNRYILSFECGKPFLVEREGQSLEMVRLQVHGQSFMMHQIRKMIGMCVAVLRGFAVPDAIQQSWESKRMDVPMVPGLGLLLEQPHFHMYDQRFGKDHVHLNTWDREDLIEAFRKDIIMPEIVDTEIRERSMFKWLETLLLHKFGEETPLDKVDEGGDAKRPRMSLPELHKTAIDASKESEAKNEQPDD